MELARLTLKSNFWALLPNLSEWNEDLISLRVGAMHTITEHMMWPLRSIGFSNKLSLESCFDDPWVMQLHRASKLLCYLALE